MDESSYIWPLFGIAIVVFLYKQYLLFTRDVPDEYLNEQSIIDSIRNPNESAIHKSTKLDYSQGLRVGLGIRYDSYKLRNGNLHDVWEIAMDHVKKDMNKSMIFDTTSVKLLALNSQAEDIRESLTDLKKLEKIDEICLHSELLQDPLVWAMIIACFTSQRTVHIHDGNKSLTSNSLELTNADGRLALLRDTDVVWKAGDLINTDCQNTTFTNEYICHKDRGIALRVTQKVNHKTTISTDFTHLNLISAVASCIKHLPPLHQITSCDVLAIIQDNASIDGLVNGMVKILAGFITGTKVILASDLATCLAHNPTIISANTDVVKKMVPKPIGIDRGLTYHRLFSLSCNRFSSLTVKKPYPSLRLVIAHRSITSTEVSPEWRVLFASLVSHVVEEIGYFNTAGPILVTDFYDFRKFTSDLAKQRRTHGAVAQPNEAKLVDLNKFQGVLAIRGYNIGKAKSVMEGVGKSNVLPDKDGFYKVPVSARWGLDGCLYVMRK